jgi:prepilin-type N-terminal cleavage/methylation domain-containing protein
MKKNKSAFTLMELLAVIAIIAILATVSVIYFDNVMQKKRDTQRTTDIAQIQNALEMYFRYENRYPDSLSFGGTLVGSTTSATTYLQTVPENPSPRDDGGCADSEYTYQATDDGKNYQLAFCLGGASGILNAGCNVADAMGIEADAPLCISDLKLWLKSDSGVELNGSNVSAWADQSGNGNDAAQATPANQPLLVGDYQNGHAALEFNGIASYLVGTTIAGLSTSSLSFFVVAAGESSTNSSGEMLFGVNDYTNGLWINRYMGNQSFNVLQNSIFANALQTTNNSLPNAGWTTKLLEHTKNLNTFANVYINGAEINNVNGASNQTAGFTNANYYVGFNPFAFSDYFKGHIMEMIIYTKFLSETERVQIENYLNAKYNIY